jgi:hypothetical protein
LTKRIYLSHCAKDKSPLAKTTGAKMTPDKLYTDVGLMAFMETCKKAGMDWAILSDRYGIYFAYDEHEYYEKHPDTVTEEEEKQITRSFEEKLTGFDEIWFYIRPATFHPFYERVISTNSLSMRVKFFESLAQIK